MADLQKVYLLPRSVCKKFRYILIVLCFNLFWVALVLYIVGHMSAKSAKTAKSAKFFI